MRLQSNLQPCTADRGGSTSLEKPATLASSEYGEGTHSADVAGSACRFTLAPLHRARLW